MSTGCDNLQTTQCLIETAGSAISTATAVSTVVMATTGSDIQPSSQQVANTLRSLWQCTNCGYETPVITKPKFCPSCGHDVQYQTLSNCHSCKVILQKGAKFCMQCGTPVIQESNQQQVSHLLPGVPGSAVLMATSSIEPTYESSRSAKPEGNNSRNGSDTEFGTKNQIVDEKPKNENEKSLTDIQPKVSIDFQEKESEVSKNGKESHCNNKSIASSTQQNLGNSMQSISSVHNDSEELSSMKISSKPSNKVIVP